MTGIAESSMAPEQRKRYLTIALILAVGALVLDRVIGLYADQRGDLVSQRDAQIRALADAQNTLKMNSSSRILRRPRPA